MHSLSFDVGPKDMYGGVGQLDAVLELLRVRSQYNLVKDEKCDVEIVQGGLTIFSGTLTASSARLDNLKSAVAIGT